MKSENRRNHSVALIATIVFHVLILVIMMVATLRYNASEPRKWPPVDSSEILFGGEYVMLGHNLTTPGKSTPAPDQSPAKSVDGDDVVSEGTTGQPQSLVSSQQESPAKVKEKPKTTTPGPTEEEIAEQQRAKREQEAAERIRNQVKFGGGGNGDGNAGSPDGNATVGAANGSPGHTLRGRTMESFGRPKSRLTGELRIKVRVNRQGQVVGVPEYVGGDGPAASRADVRNSCIEASKVSRFSVALDATAEQVGIITWRFE